MRYLLKTERGHAATDIDENLGSSILDRGRHEGRRVVEVFVLHPDGRIDRFEERARRKLGSNAISSRTWLCQTYLPEQPELWGADRYVPNPEEDIQSDTDALEAVVLVLTGAEHDPDSTVAQLTAITTGS